MTHLVHDDSVEELEKVNETDPGRDGEHGWTTRIHGHATVGFICIAQVACATQAF